MKNTNSHQDNRLTIRANQGVLAKLKIEVKQRGVKKSQIVREALDLYFNREVIDSKIVA